MNRAAPALLLLLVCLGAPAAAQSDSVTGIVIDHRTEQPISGVLVYVEDHPQVATTDKADASRSRCRQVRTRLPHR